MGTQSFDKALVRDSMETIEFLHWALGLTEGEIGVTRQEVVDFWRKRGGGNTYGKRLLTYLVQEGKVTYDPITKVVTGIVEEGAGAEEGDPEA